MLFVVLKVSIRKDNDFLETMAMFHVKFYFSGFKLLHILCGFLKSLFQAG